MKDITIALELTLPKEVNDQQIKAFVEAAIQNHLKQLRQEHFYNRVDWKEESYARYNWTAHGMLGIDEHVIDVIGVADGALSISGDRVYTRLEGFRRVTAV